MAKKTEKLSKEYLEEKFKTFSEQQDKIEELIQRYSEVWQKLAGAKEAVQNMLDDITEQKPDEVKNE